MKILFVSSGHKGFINPIIENQGESLKRAGVELDYYMVKGRGWKSYVKNIKPLREQIIEGGYDVVHVHYAFSAYMASMATIGLKVSVVVSLMGSDIWAHKYYPFIVRVWNKLARWRAVIVKSAEMRQRVGMPSAIVVPNGVNMDQYCPKPKAECKKMLGWDSEKTHVLMAANPDDPRKNGPLAIKAVGLLNASGKYNIEFHGMVGVPNEETPIWYNAADAVVLPSLYEGSANAVKEAMACDKPLVTTDMGDCRERMEGCKGCYVANTYEVKEFAELIAKALKDNTSKGRERLLKDGIADYQIAERLIGMYKSMIKMNK